MKLNLKEAINLLNKADKLSLTLSTRLNLIGKIITWFSENEEYEKCDEYLKMQNELIKIKDNGKIMYVSKDEITDLIRNNLKKQC